MLVEAILSIKTHDLFIYYYYKPVTSHYRAKAIPFCHSSLLSTFVGPVFHMRSLIYVSIFATVYREVVFYLVVSIIRGSFYPHLNQHAAGVARPEKKIFRELKSS